MESVANIQSESKSGWLTKRCRNLVFGVLEKLTQDSLDVVEGNQITHFGQESSSHKISMNAKIIITDQSAYVDFVKGGSIGVAEAFIEDKWHSPNLTDVIRVFARAQQITDNIDSKKSWLAQLKNKIFHRLNRNSQSGSKKNIVAHYDLGNELYARFLDKTMMYSSAVYPNENSTLEEAQFHKLETICKKLSLNESDHVIEIGTGWGGLAVHMAKHYGCNVTTTTISEEQFAFAEQLVKSEGLENKITLLKNDYRDLTGQYDKLVSIEMIEAVGHEYLQSFFEQCNQLIKPKGKVLIQAITIADQRLEHYSSNVDFIQRYIFPGGFLPSITLMSQQLCQHTNMVMESLDDIGLDYARTLAHWRDNFLENWAEISQHGYDENFKRLWLYYFAYCEGAFLERATSTVHIVARKPSL